MNVPKSIFGNNKSAIRLYQILHDEYPDLMRFVIKNMAGKFHVINVVRHDLPSLEFVRNNLDKEILDHQSKYPNPIIPTLMRNILWDRCNYYIRLTRHNNKIKAGKISHFGKMW